MYRQMYRLKFMYCLKCNHKEIARLFAEQEANGIHNIPVFVISYNRLSYVEKMVRILENSGYRNIHIIDNASTYPPLLDYLRKTSCDVIRMKENKGHMVFWNDSRFDKYRNNFYVVTDPDIEPISECPNDFIERFFFILKEHPYVRKVGFSLKIDDLPKNGILSEEAFEWEKQFYEMKIKDVYYADIDTTMALYMPDVYCKHLNFYRAFRTAFPYVAKHLPWYKVENDVTEEDIYYSKHKTTGWWDPLKSNKLEEHQIKERKNGRCLPPN